MLSLMLPLTLLYFSFLTSRSKWSPTPMDPAAAGAPRRKANSDNPAVRYALWPDLGRKDVVLCMLCGQKIHAGVERLVRHLAGDFSEVNKCPETTTKIKEEMRIYLGRRKFKAIER